MRLLDYWVLMLVVNMVVGFPSKQFLPTEMYEAQALVRFSIVGAYIIAVIGQELCSGVKRIEKGLKSRRD